MIRPVDYMSDIEVRCPSSPVFRASPWLISRLAMRPMSFRSRFGVGDRDFSLLLFFHFPLSSRKQATSIMMQWAKSTTTWRFSSSIIGCHDVVKSVSFLIIPTNLDVNLGVWVCHCHCFCRHPVSAYLRQTTTPSYSWEVQP